MMPETYVLAGIDVIPSIMEFKEICGITSILEKGGITLNKAVISVEPKLEKFKLYRLTKHITPENGVMCR
ncbi:hypothetical protein MNBD_GAMMA11-2023 [hydrothermal vent metagenome]|uniref:Uncharacterized protein n=1 Tax=hydrothermal vent metagenome TaxID=652676 RepID=A0A3B0XS86_9ZZZZ